MNKRILSLAVATAFTCAVLLSFFALSPSAHALASERAANQPNNIPCPDGGSCGGGSCFSEGSIWDASYTATAGNINVSGGQKISLAEETNTATFTYHDCNRPSISNQNCVGGARLAVQPSASYCQSYGYGDAGIELEQDSSLVFQGATVCNLEDLLGTDEYGYQLEATGGNC